MAANTLSFNQISAEMNAIHAQAIGAQPPRAINTRAVMTQAQAALLGADTQLVPLTVNENGIFDPPAGKGFGTVTVTVPNPNSVEIISGTGTNPFGSVDVVNLRKAIANNNVTVKMDAVFSGYKFHLIAVPRGDQTIAFIQLNMANDDVTQAVAAEIAYVRFVLSHALYMTGGSIQDISAYSSAITTTLTIIHHPIPEENNA